MTEHERELFERLWAQWGPEAAYNERLEDPWYGMDANDGLRMDAAANAEPEEW